MGKIINFPGAVPDDADIDPDQVLEAAKGHTKMVVVIGWDADDNLFGASSTNSGPEILWLLEKVKQGLM